MRAIRIDTSQIPAVDVQNLSRTFLTAIQRFYEDPENVKRFEEWKRARDTTVNNKFA